MTSARGYVLLVDDDLEIRETMREVLMDDGYRVETTANGLEALEWLRARRLGGEELPGLILLDLMMPEMNGWQFCDELSKDRRLSNIPVVIISAATLRELHPAIADRPILKKPIELDALLGAVESHVHPAAAVV